MRRVLRFIMFFLLAGFIIIVGVILALAMYYRNNFPVNTWINGVYCTGKTVEQINEELINGQEASMISIVDAEGIYWELDMQAAGIRPDFTEQLNFYLQKNATFFWLKNLGNQVSQEFRPENYVVSEEKFREAFEALPFIAAESGQASGVKVCYSEDGYYLQDGNKERLNVQKGCSVARNCLEKGQTTIFLYESGCYEDLPDDEEDKRQRAIWEQVCGYIDRSGELVYDMGSEKIVFTPDLSCRFLKKEEGSSCPMLDAEGKLVIEEEQVREWIAQLKEAYDTYGREREFLTTRGETITVEYVTYGTELDGEAEEAFLLEMLELAAAEAKNYHAESLYTVIDSDNSEEEYKKTPDFDTEDSIAEGIILHVPEYKRQGYARGLDDIGGTYIEIDMTEQKMYYYVEGELTLETDVVTGDTGKGRGTPVGIYYVYNMERNRTLRGTGYTSFVKYWMPINGGVGIHDASWRRTFGGEIYKRDGSHGCINTPTDVMERLYETAEIGTPAIVFY